MVMQRVVVRQGSWQRLAEEVRETISEYNRDISYMTDYERMQADRKISNLQVNYGKTVIAGALGQWNAAKQGLKNALEKVEAERAAETRRWDAGRLADEMRVYRDLVNARLGAEGGRVPDALEGLRALYQEAQDSGDGYKQRAAAEVFSGLPGQVNATNVNDGMVINSLSKKAGRDLAKIRSTVYLERAHEAAEEAVTRLTEAKQVIVEADSDMGWTRPNGELGESNFVNALASVTQNSKGQFIFED